MKKIYTKKGDKGFTYLFNGKKVAKDHPRIQALGSIDELNSTIGIAISFSKDKKIRQELINIQRVLFLIGEYLADFLKDIKAIENRIKEIENLIDKLSIKLSKLTHFILPGGVKEASFLHQSRAICRRCERNLVPLLRKEKIDKNTIVYINRLSDLLFVMARYANLKSKKKEIGWKK